MFRVHVPALARVVINASICVNPDWARKHCDGSANEEQERQERFEHASLIGTSPRIFNRSRSIIRPV
jgi:hypothetical protein